MELECKQEEVERHTILVTDSTSCNFYSSLRFRLLASTWLPRPAGVCLWSALHVLLAVSQVFQLVLLLAVVMLAAALYDAVVLTMLLFVLLVSLAVLVCVQLVVWISVGLAWLWRMITCKCCTRPAQEGEGLALYIRYAGGTLRQPSSPRTTFMEGGAPVANVWEVLQDFFHLAYTGQVVRLVKDEGGPYWSSKFGTLCHEIVPWYDALVV